MKKIILLSLVLCITTLSNAQLFTIGKQEIGFLYLGPKVGMGGSWMSNTTGSGESTSTLFSYQAGIVGKFGITESVAIQPELIFARKGSKVTNSEFDYESKGLANYLGIPILAKISVLKIGKMRFNGSVGIYNNLSLSHKTETQYITDSENYSEEIQSDYYRKVDFGVSIGGGLEYDLDIALLVSEILVEHGVIDMYTNDISTGSNRNTSVTLAFTFLFDFVDISAGMIN